MDPQIVQHIRYKLQKRIRRLNSVDHPMFIPSLRQFWVFFDSNQVFAGIIEPVVARYPDLTEAVEKILKGEGLVAQTEEEAAAIGYKVLRHLATCDNEAILIELARPFRRTGKFSEALETCRDMYLEPFYEFLDESMDDQRAMLTLLLRYKHRCEWFHRNRLWEVVHSDSRRGEKLLALDLYEYLHNQGMDFTIEPSSLSGEIDLIAAQGSDDPLLVDTKIFDAKDRGKTYIRKGFNQIYTYTQQYNEPFGYLIVYKTTETDLRFALSTAGNIPLVIHNHKVIIIITIDLFPNPKPVSQRSPLTAIEITEQELLQTLPSDEAG